MTDEYLTGPKGTYRLLQRIGAGGMGIVHLALDEDGRTLAVKELHPSLIDDDMLRRLEREVTSMHRVSSPYVAEIRDADVRGERPFVATRYVQGRALDKTVRERGPLEGQSLIHMAMRLATALQAIHDAGIIHRDLKPSNVMLSEGEPVIIDFGIAQAIDATRLTHTGVVVGTPGYVAPEVVNGDEAERPADIFAWAATVAYAATGRSPFGTGPAEVVFFRVAGGQSDLHGVPEPLLPVLRSALARDPGARPTAAELAERLATLKTEEAPETASPETAPGADAATEPMPGEPPAANEPRAPHGRPPAAPPWPAQATPGPQYAQGGQVVPGAEAGPGAPAGPSTQAVPGGQAAPGTQWAPGTQAAPGMPGGQAVPGAQAAYGAPGGPGPQYGQAPAGRQAGSGPQLAQGGPPAPGAPSGPQYAQAGQASPGGQSPPGGQGTPGGQGVPGGQAGPGGQSVPGGLGVPGGHVAPGTQGGAYGQAPTLPAGAPAGRLGVGLGVLSVAGLTGLAYVLPVAGILVGVVALVGLGMRDRIRPYGEQSSGAALGAALWRAAAAFAGAGVVAWAAEALFELVAGPKATSGQWPGLRDMPTTTILAAFVALTVLLACGVPRWRAPSRALARMVTGGDGLAPVLRYGLIAVSALAIIAALFAPAPSWFPIPLNGSVTFGDVLG